MRALAAVLLAALAALYLLPFWTVVTTSLKDDLAVRLTRPIEPPPSPTLEPYAAAFERLGQGLANSLAFTALATALSTVLGSVMGYILSKHRFRGSTAAFLLLSFGIFIPYQAVIIPLLFTMRSLGLYNTVLGLALVHTAYGIPITTLFFKNYYDELPDSLINAGKIDGAGTWGLYRSVVLPLSWPAFVVSGVFQFTAIWNDFLFGLVLTAGSGQPASVALANLLGTTSAQWNVQMAGTLIYALPVVAVYVALGKYLVRGYLSGAVRG